MKAENQSATSQKHIMYRGTRCENMCMERMSQHLKKGDGMAKKRTGMRGKYIRCWKRDTLEREYSMS